MNDFEYVNPVKVLFGKGKIAKIKDEVPAGARVLITYGGGSIKTMASTSRSSIICPAAPSSSLAESRPILSTKP
jgi:hypothetical protein